MKGCDHVRSFGPVGLLCGGILGLLFLLYPDTFPRHATVKSVLLVGCFLGAALQRLLSTLFFNPLLYYASLLQLTLLRRLIGEKTQGEIIKELTIRYFLGERLGDRAGSAEEKRAGVIPPTSQLKE